MPSPLKIVLCDDDPDEELIFRLALEPLRISFELTWIPNGWQLIDHLMETNSSPDLVFLDVDLGAGLSGIQVLPPIRKICPKTRIVMHSGRNDKENIKAAFDAGTNLYIVKDYSLTNFQLTLRAVFGNHGKPTTCPDRTLFPAA